MLRRTFAILAVLVMVCAMLPAATAESYPYVAYTTTKVVLRSGASETSAVLMTLSEGSAVVVNGAAGNYDLVDYEGKQGYISHQYLTSGAAVSQSSYESLLDDYVTLLNGDRGLAVRALQDALSEIGFYQWEAHGAYDGNTFDAVMAFQKANGLAASGIADAATQRKLYEETVVGYSGKKTKVSYTAPLKTAEIKAGKKGEAVKMLQSVLGQLGYSREILRERSTKRP